MIESTDTFLYKCRLFMVGLLMIGSVFLLAFFLSAIFGSTVQASDNSSSNNNVSSSSYEDSPNVVTSGVFTAADNFNKTTTTIQKNLNHNFSSVTNSISSATAQSGKLVANSGKFAVGVVGGGANIIAKGVGGGASFLAQGVAGSVPVIKDSDYILANDEMVKVAAKSASNKKTLSTSKANAIASWPIHGEITEEFGVPHWPYQPIHTGIDISDATAPGTTPIHPFKPGRVIEVIHSYSGFGNHVIIDNGGGITSLYGHMNSTAVKVGQQVTKSTILGYEGTTGASTGVHVHFEVRLNGTPVNPHNYVSGHP
jgi:murein DD-endopeptidase MepM/ murein hydrolase activator NlpD